MILTPAAIDALLKTFGFFHPEDASLIAFLEAHEDLLAKLAAVADAIADEGPLALAAAKKAAPRLTGALLAVVDAFPLQAKGIVAAPFHGAGKAPGA